MQAQDFAKFVESQQDKDQNTADEAEVDWAEIRETWLHDLDSLYTRVIDYLHEFVAAGSISYSFAEVTLTEENIGTYQARRLDIQIGRQHVFLEPIATLLIECRGTGGCCRFSGPRTVATGEGKSKKTG